jgi:hypothetical protein
MSNRHLGSALLALSLILSSRTLSAQGTPTVPITLRPFVGAYIPTADQRDFLKDAVLVGTQASWNATNQLSVTGTFAWAPSKDKITAGNQKLDAFQYDLGVELRSAATNLGPVSPFVAGGLGGRTYSYRDLNVDSKSDFDGYGGLGLDASFGVVSVRVEGRDYVSRFQPLTGSGSNQTRNDIALFAALGLHF